MSYPIDYIKTHGKYTFNNMPFNEIDGLIFSVLSLIDVDNSIPSKENVYITYKSVVANQIRLHGLEPFGAILPASLTYLIYESGNALRYQNLKVHSLFNLNDLEEETQSTFFIIDLDDVTSIIVFGSTDDSINGWREDFNMLVQDIVPCLTNALKYVENNFDEKRNYYFVGHSKGGFISHYVASFTNDLIKSHLIKAISYDGPGYAKSICESKEAKQMIEEDKLVLLSPEYAVVSRMFNQIAKPHIIKCSFIGQNSHDPSCWKIKNYEFVKSKKFAKKSSDFIKDLNDVVLSLDQDARQDFIDSVFLILDANHYRTLTDLKNNPIFAIKNYLSLPKDKQKPVKFVLSRLISKLKIVTQMIESSIMSKQNQLF